jgi:endonuclease YncB( thermonuclease family)
MSESPSVSNRSRRQLYTVLAGVTLFFCFCCGVFALLPSSSPDEPSVPNESAQTTETISSTSVADEPSPASATSTHRPVATRTPTPTNTVRPTITSTQRPTISNVSQATTTPGPSATIEITTLFATVPAGETATVTDVIDGDTIEVTLNGASSRVRYIGMDTPERGDPYFSEATQANSNLVAGQTVILVKDVSETDRYGRLLRYVYLPDGTFVNAELVRLGYAQVATFPPDVRYVDLYISLEQEARNAGSGLWSPIAAIPTSTPIPPPTNTPVVLATNTPLPLPTQTPVPLPTNPPPPPAPGNVQITYIYYDGQVSQVESDEYAVVTNNGGSVVNLSGWRLNAGDPGQDFGFPSFDLQPGQSCRIYTNESHPDTCGFTFGSGSAIWNNGGDCGYLYDASGVEVSHYCY